MVITTADKHDVPELNALVNAAYRGESSKKGWTTEADLLDGIRTDEKALSEVFSDPMSLILKCTLGQKIVGCVHLKKEGKRLYLGMLTVDPEMQGKGVGKILLNATEDEARKRDCSSIFMTVISVRKELIAWYLRHGYVDSGITKPFPYGDPRFGIPKMPLEFVVLEKPIL